MSVLPVLAIAIATFRLWVCWLCNNIDAKIPGCILVYCTYGIEMLSYQSFLSCSCEIWNTRIFREKWRCPVREALMFVWVVVVGLWYEWNYISNNKYYKVCYITLSLRIHTHIHTMAKCPYILPSCLRSWHYYIVYVRAATHRRQAAYGRRKCWC